MNALAKLRAFGLLLAIGCLAVVGCQGGAKPEESAGTKVSGELLGFEVGDYVHAIVKDDKGTETSYYIGDYPLNYFLAAHVGKKLDLELETKMTFLEEAGQEVETTKIAKASFKGTDVAAWWKKELESATEEELKKKYDALIEEKDRSRVPEEAEPITMSLGGWVFGVKQGDKWAEPGQELHEKAFVYASPDGQQMHASLTYSEDGPLPSVSMSIDVDKHVLQVSGGKATFVGGKRISATDAGALKVAKDYAGTKGKGGLKVAILDGIEADLDGDGKMDQILAIGSGSTLDSKKTADYYAVIVRTQDKTLELVHESEFGEMRGPFTGKVLAVGDLDGDGVTECVATSEDPWGDMVYVFQLAAGPAIQVIHSAGRGE